MKSTTLRLGPCLAFVCSFAVALPPALAQPPPSEPARPGPADAGPALELAPEHEELAPDPPSVSRDSGAAPDSALVRGLAERRFRRAAESASGTSIGGYGEIQARGLARGRGGEREWVADIPRLVVFFAHVFNDSFRFYSEVEVEHTLSCASCPGAVEIEQATIDWRLLGDLLGLRAGLLIIPMGIINPWHEPPIFHGVVRPRVDTVIIPSTWRELGAGIFGNPIGPLRYELYAVTGLDPMKLNAGGLAGARQNGGLATANAWSFVSRVEWEPLLGAVLGASGYYSDAGPNGKFFDAKRERLELSVPIIGWDVDVRFRRSGLEWRVVFAEWHLPEAEALMLSRNADGQQLFDPTRPVPSRMRGGYVEGAYDVLRPLRLSHQLLPFARIEYYNTQSDVPARYDPHPSYSVREYTFGVSYRPLQQVVVKADYQLRNRRLGFDETQLNFGLGFMY